VAVIFPPSANRIPALIAVIAGIGGIAAIGGITYYFSPEFTDVGYQPTQPVAFSHKLHAGELELDCRYCHNTVEQAAHAAIPPTETCMNCHKFVKADSDKLALVRESYAQDTPIPWVRVHMLPDYAFFNHSVHLAAGVGCASCHGRVDQMEVVRQEKPLSMSWCLSCHRNPEPNLRPKGRDLVTKMDYVPGHELWCDPESDPKRGCEVIPPEHCSGCHR
jgi:hypothetical protein